VAAASVTPAASTLRILPPAFPRLCHAPQ
jgi:hypothetical protein